MSDPSIKPALLRLTIKYERGHSYGETWELTDLFCPCCGKQPVWNEDGPGDYYVGSDYLCLNCGVNFSLPVISNPEKPDWQDKQRLEGIRAKLENPK